jgi:hypothetical protein
MNTSTDCKGCSASVKVPQREIDRIVAELCQDKNVPLTDQNTYLSRMAICKKCEDLLYGTTCRHCGCFISVRARFAEKNCPGIPEKWQ